MDEIKILTRSGKFILNNNSEKYTRALEDAGEDSSPEEILAHYDKLAGLIKDEKGNIIKNGIFWKAYQKWEREQPEFIRTLDQRVRGLDEAENELIQSISLNIGHKRAFLGTLMTISAATIVGLFVMFDMADLDGYLAGLMKISGLGHALFIVASNIWLMLIMSQESELLDSRLKFIRKSKKELIDNVGISINDLDSYEQFRNEKNIEEQQHFKNNWISSEWYFKSLCLIFALSCVPLIRVFFLS